METFTYIVVGVGFAFVAWWLLKVVVGIALPLEKTARAYLVQLLKKWELHQAVPASCIDECVNESIHFASSSTRLLGKKQDLRSETVAQIELHADMLRLWLRSDDSFTENYKKNYKTMFEKHAVPRLKQ